MYVVMVYNESVDGFKAYLTEDGTVLKFDDWGEAAAAASTLSATMPTQQFRVWFTPVNRKRTSTSRSGKVVRVKKND